VARALEDRYEITVITARMRRSLPREEMMGRVRVVRVGFGVRLDKWLYPALAARAACRMKPDLIHAVLESFAGEALVRCAAKRPAVPRLLTCQSTNTRLRLEQIHRAAHRITAISSVLVDRAKKFKHRHVMLIPNGIPLSDIERERKRTAKIPGRILFVGRLEPMKGVDILLEACAKILKEGVADGLRIVGSGSQERFLRRRAKQLDIAEHVTFVGYLSPPAVYHEFAEAPIFCALSRSEALGNVFLEAQAAGCAVLATKTGGIPDIVKDGETGLLVKPDNVKAATETLRQLLDDPQLREHLSKAAIQHAREYDWGTIAERYATVYEDMLG